MGGGMGSLTGALIHLHCVNVLIIMMMIFSPVMIPAAGVRTPL